MAMEPINLFSRIKDPAAVAQFLRERWPSVAIEGPDSEWLRAVVAIGDLKLTLQYGPEYHAEPNWSTQMNGMSGFLSRFPDTERKQIAVMLPTTFQYSLAAIFDPEPASEEDPRFAVLYAVAERLDGILFSPFCLRDARGRILVGADGEDEEDPEAVWPRVVAAVTIPPSTGTAPPATGVAPTAQRVARRALAMTAVTARAILEQDGVTIKPASFNPLSWMRRVFSNRETERQEVIAWIEALGIGDELEPEEWEIVQRPVGHLEPQQQINSTWRLEGLAVLAWSLRRIQFPPHDALVDFHSMWRELGLLDLDTARLLLAHPILRPRNEIEAMRKRLFALHWRLRNFHVDPKAMDYAKFARTAWFGPLDSGLPLADGDLMLQGERIDRATPDAFSTAHSASLERHQAVNWVWEGPDRYSNASADT
ncbi:MAG TPA: DUF4272 domain-containing protein [Gemmataceae bacterium]|nr:DUF4272 domain-containing protein [Gemmataceae bacterium]